MEEIMKTTKIEFQFDSAKIEAINLFLKDQNTTISEALENYMGAIYRQYVPQQVRDFIDRKEKEAQATKSSSRKKSEDTEESPV
jgi:hypothetical protein